MRKCYIHFDHLIVIIFILLPDVDDWTTSKRFSIKIIIYFYQQASVYILSLLNFSKIQ